MTNTSDIAWLAGIIDGEGCFSIKSPVRFDRKGRGCHQVWLVLCNTNRPMVERAARIVESIIGAKPPTIRKVWKGVKATRHQYWLNLVAKRDLLLVTEALIPHLTSKWFEANVVAWYLKRACAVAMYRQTELDALVLKCLSATKRNSGEAPAEVLELLREVIPSEAFLAVGAADRRNERVETRGVSANDKPLHECPGPDHVH